MKNNDGFTLIETVIALLIFSTTVAIVIPAIVTVQQERQAIRTERMVEERLLNYYYHDLPERQTIEESFEVDSIIFHVSTQESGTSKLLCISWRGGNKREYERCLSKKSD